MTRVAKHVCEGEISWLHLGKPPVSECPYVRPLRHICSISHQPHPSVERLSRREFTDTSEVVTSCGLLYIALGWIPALAASVLEGGCWGHSDERLAKKGKGADGRKVSGREDVLLGPDTEFFLFLLGLGIVQCPSLLLECCFFSVIVFIVCIICSLPAHTYIYHVLALCLWKSEKVTEFLGTGVLDSGEPLCGWWELYLGPLQE